MAKVKWTLANSPNDPIFNGGYVISSHNKRSETDTNTDALDEGSTVPMPKVLFYYEWQYYPAVIVETTNEEHVQGFFMGDDGKWTLASIPQLLDFVKEGREMPLDAFEATFGRIGRELPKLVI